ncbi:MAG: TIGR00725 family protein [Syntrophobacterales bacterium]|nr:MAG: TIGR00725 family protein [Syntrophobacterales bacterium]
MQIGVIGASRCNAEIEQLASAVGREIGSRGAVLICGGLGGVMEFAAKGAKEAGGFTIGILPGTSKEEANGYIDIPIVTGLGHARNVIIAHSSDSIIAISGEHGTLSEIAIGLKLKKTVIGLNTWDIEGVIRAKTAGEAVEKAITVSKGRDI